MPTKKVIFPIGYRSGDWIVTSEETERKSTPYQNVKCIYCGYEKAVRKSAISTQSITECKQCKQHKKDDILGARFGRLVAVSVVSYIPFIVRCKCDCGNMKDVQINCLRYGMTRSCGCLQHEANKVNWKHYLEVQKANCEARSKDLTGQCFGYLEVLGKSYKLKNRQHWRCKCGLCGAITETPTTYSLEHGLTRSCGCLPKEYWNRNKNIR